MKIEVKKMNRKKKKLKATTIMIIYTKIFIKRI